MIDCLLGKSYSPDPAMDWSSLVEQIRLHRLGPMMLRHLPDDVPPFVRAQLNEQKKQAAFEALRTLQERDVLLQSLDEAQCQPVVLLKGAVTGWLVYPDPTLRPMTDLDVLVDRSNASAVAEVLRGRGYEAIETHPTRAVSRAHVYERLFAKTLVADTVLQAVDVHIGFAQHHRYPIDYDAVLQRIEPFEQGGPSAYRLNDVDHLLHLAIHMARDQFMGSLRHLLDIHLWITNRPPLWAALIERAMEWGAQGTLFMTLQLTHEVFGTAVPAPVLSALDPGGLRGRFLRWWHRPTDDRLIRWDVGIRIAQAMALIPLMDKPIQRARFVGQYAWLRSRDVLSR